MTFLYQTASLLVLGSSYYCNSAMTVAAFSNSATGLKAASFSPSLKCTGRPANHDSHGNRCRSSSHVRLHMSVPNSLDVLTSGLASIFCLPRGVTVVSPNTAQTSNKNSHVRITKLYDVENSNSCREVRERITELDLVVEQIIPVADGSQNTASMPGKKAPIMVAATTASSDGDESSDEETMLEGTEAILSFLDKSFENSSGTGSQDSEEEFVAIAKEKLKIAGLYLASSMRSGRGESVSPSMDSRPEQPLILYSYEGNQFCRLVREVLSELDIVYELRSAGKESPRRSELASITGGSSQCPYLIDPNTGSSMSESADIVEYLYQNYASWTPPSELLEWASTNVMSLAKPVFKLLAPLQAGEKDAENNYKGTIEDATREIYEEATASPIVVYTYELSPFSSETTLLLDRLGVKYKEISLGKEWLPGLIAENGAIKRAALLEMTGQSSLPHIFVNGKPIGGLFSGSPGLLPMLKNGEFSGDSLDTTASSSSSSPDTTDAFQ